jgi:hypothetical protein
LFRGSEPKFAASARKVPEAKIIALDPMWMIAPKWALTAAGIFLGIMLEYRAFSSFHAGEFDRGAATSAFAGFLCFLCSGAKRALYLADAGIVSETRFWGYSARRIAPWSSVRSVSFIHGNKCLTVAFEADSRVWKLPFPKETAEAVYDLLCELLPECAEIMGYPR